MKQVLQNMRDGKTEVVEIPTPFAKPGMALVHNAASLVSAGTERMLVEFAGKNLIGKAQSRPDLVLQVVDKARREGVLPTLKAAINRLNQPMPLGYSSAGTIVEIGKGLTGFKVGDRVACSGGGFAVHAEYVVVPKNLLVLLPPEVDLESATFTTLAAIAMHGYRLAQPQLGEKVAIIGLGLLGLLGGMIARAAGCQVLGFDLATDRIELAQKLGLQAVLRVNAEPAGKSFTQGQGFDVILICADSRSDDPIHLAGSLARDRGRVIAIGAVGLNIPRKIYYDKELHFQVSRSYGPGRYDPQYEEGGVDYPAGYVRWTEGRNLSAVVDLMAQGRLDVKPLITHRFPIGEAPSAYELIAGKNNTPFLGVLLTYPEKAQPVRQVKNPHQISTITGQPCLGVLGAGNYALATFLPAVDQIGRVNKIAIASASGVSARHAMQRFGFQIAGSSEIDILENPEINIVAILTRHQQHTRQIIAALKAGKHVYCEKPLAINLEELSELEDLLQNQGLPLLTAGFNRRFAPFSIKLKEFLPPGEPFVAHYRVNAGALPLTHWLHDPMQGGGRLVGEGCHFIDFLSYLADAAPKEISAQALPDQGQYRQDNLLVTMRFPNGSLGSLAYLANGDKSLPKERLEIFCAGHVASLEDFRSLELVKNGHRQVLRDQLGQDKGHRAAWGAFLKAVQTTGQPPIPYDQLIGVTRASLEAAGNIAKG